MALTAAELVAYLRVDKSGFDRDLSGAERQMGKSEGKFQQWTKGMGQAAAETVTAGAAATAGLATTVFLTGANYNTLQQQSRAALETIMGGAEEANAQMDKLDEFAKTSPFAKDVFIQAQQQLLGFGMEAENVVPTLSAIQDAVAAVGGSNEDIAGIATVLAKVEGTGKITADTLNQLGIRGIDAATIIGEEMGKTGNEIRESITDGTLGADDAMAALTTGMTERFGGAAENVKDTMVGALDRIKAATRDIGAELARPFVDPNGGGKAVEWANEFADVLRSVEDQTGPFVDMLMQRFSPAFDTVSESLKDAKDAVDRFDMEDLDAQLDSISQYAPAIAGVSGALLTMGLSNVPIIGRLASALGPIPGALGAAALASPEMRDALGDLGGALEPLLPVIGDVAGLLAGAFGEALEIAAGLLSTTAEIITPLVEGFRDLPEPIQTTAGAIGAFIATRKLMPDFTQSMGDGFNSIKDGISGTIGQFQGWDTRFQGAADEALSFSTKLDIVRDDLGKTPTGGLRGALGGVVSFLGGPWGIALTGATIALGFWAKSHAETRARVDELADSLDRQSGAWTASTDSLISSRLAAEFSSEKLDDLGMSYDDLVEAVKSGGDSYDDLRQKFVDQYMASQNVAEGTAGYSDALQNANAEADSFLDPLINLQGELNDAEQAVLDEAAALEAAEDATSDAKRAQEEFSEAVAIAADDTKLMDERVRGLKDALDVLNGVQKSSEQAARDLHDSNQSLAEFIKGVAEESDGLAAGLWDIDEGMATISDDGNRFSEMLGQHEEDMLAAAIAAYDKAGGDENAAEAARAASDAYGEQVGKLEEVLIQSGMSEEEVAGLISTMERTPEEIAFAVSSNASATELEVIQLTNTIDALPDGDTHITDNETSNEVMGMLEDLGYDVERLPDGRVKVTAAGLDTTLADIQEVARGPYTAEIEVKSSISRSGAKAETSSGAGARAGAKVGNYHGGIDRFTGMADGGVTPASIMDVAQMVAPGDIRFAGDRSDVDEAWIPLDGSKRSLAILNEAIARMPGFELPEATGRASGGIDGTVTPPQVEAANAPDMSELETVWQDAMAVLEESTRGSFEQIETDTAAAQSATTANTQTQMGEMRDITAQQLAMMVALTTSNMTSMDDATGQATRSMRDATLSQFAQMRNTTNTEFNQMRSDGSSQTELLRSNASAQFQAMRNVGEAQTSALRGHSGNEFSAMRAAGERQTSALRDHSGQQFSAMRSEGNTEATQLRASAATQFSLMRDQGVTAASDLRSGIVSEMGQTRSPFTSRINDLVEVMRSFSSSLNKAYGDMGVDVGTPTRLATGGIMPGYTPGLDVHKFASPTGGQLELSGGEAVMRPEFTRAVGSDWIHTMNAAARTGGVSAIRDAIQGPTQSFDTGGIIGEFTKDAKQIGAQHKSKLPANWVRPAGVDTIDEVIRGIEKHFETMMSGEGWVRPTSGRITSPYGAGRGAYPHAGIDIAGGHGRVVSATAGIVRETGWNIGPGRTGLGILAEHPGNLFTYSGHAPVGGIRVKPGDPVTTGQHISHQGNTGNSTGDHLHWEVHQGRAWNDVNPMPYWNAAGAGGSVAVGGGGGSDRWNGTVMQALRLAGLPTTGAYVNAWMRQIQTESGGNASAVQGIRDINSIMGNHARGLLQVIPPTFSAFSLPGMRNIMNPLHNAVAGMRYAKSRYGVSGMLNAIGQGRGYELGTHHAKPGWSLVGENGPELLRFRGGEKVLNNRQTRQAMSSPGMTMREADLFGRAVAKHMRSRGDVNINNPVTRDTDGLAKAAATAIRRETKRLSRV